VPGWFRPSPSINDNRRRAEAPAPDLSLKEHAMSDLLVITFPTEAQAEEVRKKLLGMQKEYLIELGDAVVAVKQPDGHVKLNQLFQPVAAGAVSGALWGSLIGLLVLMPLAGAALGAASGALRGKMTDVGIDDTFMKEAAAVAAFRQCRAVPADPQDDDGQGDRRVAGHGRHHPAQFLRRDEGRDAAPGPGRCGSRTAGPRLTSCRRGPALKPRRFIPALRWRHSMTAASCVHHRGAVMARFATEWRKLFPNANTAGPIK
jgi:hypothetical protein